MVFFIILFMLSLFSYFFYEIWTRYFSILPIAVFIFMLSHWVKNVFTWINFNFLQEKRSLILIWLLTMIWLSWILFFVWLEEISVFILLLIFNIFLWFVSYMFFYNDWKMIFEFWFWLLIFIILWTSLFSFGFSFAFEIFSFLISLVLWVYSFLNFVLWIFFERKNIWLYQIVSYVIIAIWCILLKTFINSDWICSLWLWMLSVVLLCIYLISQIEVPSNQSVKISVRRILAWERIFKRMNIPNWKIVLHDWFEKSPNWFIRSFEVYNLLILLYLLCSFYLRIYTHQYISLWFRYWIWISLFLLNVFLLKKNDYASDVSRFSLAFIVNFILYSILLTSWSTIEWILPLLIVWGFWCQILLFFVNRINIKLFSIKDYRYWMIVTFIATIFNVILLTRVNLPIQFLFSLIFVYIWVELMMLYYIVQFLYELKESIENAEKKERQAIQELALTDINIDDN